MTKDELKKIMKLVEQAYELAGKKITMAELYAPDSEEPEVLIAPQLDDKDLN